MYPAACGALSLLLCRGCPKCGLEGAFGALAIWKLKPMRYQPIPAQSLLRALSCSAPSMAAHSCSRQQQACVL